LWLIVAGTAGAAHKKVEHYRRIAAAWGVTDRIVFIDRFIPDEEVSDLFEMSDFSVLTYSLAFTSQSAVLSSAVTFRKPVLVTPCATFAETLREYAIGALCPGESASDIEVGLRQMTELLDGDAIFEFDRFLRENSWRTNAEKTVEFYRELLATNQTENDASSG